MRTAGLSVFGPTGFRDYLLEHGLSGSRTADHISVSHFDGLPAALKGALDGHDSTCRTSGAAAVTGDRADVPSEPSKPTPIY